MSSQRRDARAHDKQALLHAVIAAQEAERARVARDLHDQTGQALTSVLLALRLVQDSLTNEPPDIAHARLRVEDVRTLVVDALRDVRQMAFELRPTVLDDIGLVAALTRLASDVTVRCGMRIVLAVPPDDEHRLPPEIETVVYRVVQEALTNVVRHAEASCATVSLDHDRADGRVMVAVSDDGRGFLVGAVDARCLGLAGMHERAALVGGDVRITTAAGAGTTVVLEVPGG